MKLDISFIVFIAIHLIFCKSADWAEGSTLKACDNSTKCSTCIDTITRMKFHYGADCRFAKCPEICLIITHSFNFPQMEPNDQILLFKSDQISSCNACFRLNYCHINECIEQEKTMRTSIRNLLPSVQQFHEIKSSDEMIQKIEKSVKDFWFNMELIVANVNKIKTELKKYVDVIKISEKLRDIHIELYNKITTRNFALNGMMELDNQDDYIYIASYVKLITEIDAVKKDYATLKREYYNIHSNGSDEVKNTYNIQFKLSEQIRQLQNSIQKFLLIIQSSKQITQNAEIFSDYSRKKMNAFIQIIHIIKQHIVNRNYDSPSQTIHQQQEDEQESTFEPIMLLQKKSTPKFQLKLIPYPKSLVTLRDNNNFLENELSKQKVKIDRLIDRRQDLIDNSYTFSHEIDTSHLRKRLEETESIKNALDREIKISKGLREFQKTFHSVFSLKKIIS